MPWLCLYIGQSDSGGKVSILVGDGIGLWGGGMGSGGRISTYEYLCNWEWLPRESCLNDL